MKTIKASEFRARCLKVIDEVAETGEPVVVTKNGIPVARLIPEKRPVKTLFGALKGSVKISGDIVGSPG